MEVLVLFSCPKINLPNFFIFLNKSPEAVFLVRLGTSSFLGRNEVLYCFLI